MNEKFFTVTDAARILGITRQRILQLVKSGKLESQKIGNFNVFTQAQIGAVRERKAGRPKKK